MRENLRQLCDLIPKGSRLELFRKGIRKSRLVSWIPKELNGSVFDDHEYLVPNLMFFYDTLESLELRPLILQKCFTLIINGLECPNLEQLTFLNYKMTLGDYQRETTYRKIEEFASQVKTQNPSMLLTAEGIMK